MKWKSWIKSWVIHFTAHTFNCVCHCIKSMFRVLGVYNFGPGFNQNSNENIVRIFALKFFVDSWKLFEAFWGLSKEAYRKPQGSYKNFQGRYPYNVFVAILENRCHHRFILSLTDLYLEKHLWDCENGFGKIETILNVLHAFHK